MIDLYPKEWYDAALLLIILIISLYIIWICYRLTADERKEFNVLRQIIEQLGETTPNDDDGGVHHAEMVTHLVNFIHHTRCFPAKKRATEHLLILACTDRIIEFEIVLQIHPTLVRGCMPKAIKKVQKDKNRWVTIGEHAIMAWYNGEIPFQDIRAFCPPN